MWGGDIKLKSSFGENVARIATGSFASQAIMIGTMPILTRLYAPEDFGALAVFSAAYAILICIITLKYDLSIILHPEHNKAVALTVLTILISLALSFVLLAIISVHYVSKNDASKWYMLLLPVATVLGSVYTCAQQWAARGKDYRWFAGSQVMQALLNVGTALVLSVFILKSQGSLVIGFVFGLAGGLIYISIPFLRKLVREKTSILSLSKIVEMAYEFRRFPMFVMPASFLTALGMNAQPFIFQAMFSLQDVGYYAIANRFLMAPSALIGGAVAEAFRSEFVDRQKHGVKNAVFFRNNLKKLVVTSVPIFGGFIVFAPSVFALLLGESYRDAGILTRYLCIGVISQFVSQPFHYVFVATGHVRTALLMQSLLTFIPIIALIYVGMSDSMERAAFFAALLTSVFSVLLIVLAYRCCKQDDTDVRRR